ncbi:MAG TPA: branched-chain amino acid ABC transporter permease [Longimicrobiaceae bacterium]|nr:branched-chain amino acid ABC transporter permease [Longimicrobiaceae bacterium]
MTLFLQQLVNGLALGSIYSLVALGLTLVYGVLGVPNFAHGTLYMIGAYAAYAVVVSAGAPYLTGLAAALAATAALGALLERVVFRPLRGRPQVNAMIASLGVLLFLQGSAQALWGADFRRLPTPLGGTVRLFGLSVSEQRLLVIAAAVGVMILLHLFLKRTTTGATIEAMAQDPEGAVLVGIDTRRTATLTFAISAALAGFAAALVAPLNLVFPAMGDVVNLKAFAIIILGGMGSVTGAIAGGFLLALAEVMGATYISSAFADLIGFAMLVLVLALRPTGLFPSRRS